MCSRLVVKFHRNLDTRTALRCKLVVEVCKRFRRGARYGCDSAVGGLPKLCFKAANEWKDTMCRTEMPEQKLTARCFSERQLSTRVNRPAMIQILLAGRQSQ